MRGEGRCQLTKLPRPIRIATPILATVISSVMMVGLCKKMAYATAIRPVQQSALQPRQGIGPARSESVSEGEICTALGSLGRTSDLSVAWP
jgi:hypothetical protein